MEWNRQTVKSLLLVICGGAAFYCAIQHLDAVTGAVAWLLGKKIVRHPLGVTAGVLILGGGIGNVIDRVCRGYVVDMFDLQFISYPIFNLADCFVVVGVILGAVYYLWFYDKYDKKEPKDDAASES